MSKADLDRSHLQPWDTYRAKPPAEALAALYRHAGHAASATSQWYWTSIRHKRRATWLTRGGAFALFGLGSALPIVAGVLDDLHTRLYLTQGAVIAFALAGLLQLADRVFGWSSGWMRYIATVTALQARSAEFEAAWSERLIQLPGEPSHDDVQALHALAAEFERDLLELQGKETERWIAEFTQSGVVLDGLIASQREAARRGDGKRGGA